MENLLFHLKEWKADIDYDIRQAHMDDESRFKYLQQSLQLSCAIGILENLGENNNIPKSLN